MCHTIRQARHKLILKFVFCLRHIYWNLWNTHTYLGSGGMLTWANGLSNVLYYLKISPIFLPMFTIQHLLTCWWIQNRWNDIELLDSSDFFSPLAAWNTAASCCPSIKLNVCSKENGRFVDMVGSIVFHYGMYLNFWHMSVTVMSLWFWSVPSVFTTCYQLWCGN